MCVPLPEPLVDAKGSSSPAESLSWPSSWSTLVATRSHSSRLNMMANPQLRRRAACACKICLMSIRSTSESYTQIHNKSPQSRFFIWDSSPGPWRLCRCDEKCWRCSSTCRPCPGQRRLDTASQCKPTSVGPRLAGHTETCCTTGDQIPQRAPAFDRRAESIWIADCFDRRAESIWIADCFKGNRASGETRHDSRWKPISETFCHWSN